MSVRSRKMLTVALVYAAGGAKSYTLDTYPGDISIPGIQEGDTEPVVILDRGDFDQLVEGDETSPGDMTLDIYHDGDLTDAAAAKMFDILNKQGKALADGDATQDPGGQVWTIRVYVTVTHPAGGTDYFKAYNARPKGSYNTAADGNKLSLSFTCYPQPNLIPAKPAIEIS